MITLFESFAEADYSVTAIEHLMMMMVMMMVMMMSRTKTSELTIVRRSPESRLSTSRLPEGLSRASWLPVEGDIVGDGDNDSDEIVDDVEVAANLEGLSRASWLPVEGGIVGGGDGQTCDDLVMVLMMLICT